MKSPVAWLLILWVYFLFPPVLEAQGIQGTIIDGQGHPLPFATIYVNILKMGSAANIEGYYQMDLPPGRHVVTFQHLGFRSQYLEITVDQGYVNQSVSLKEEPQILQTIHVESDREDPAYTIMRKAIAKAKYHTQQLDEYTAVSYLKGSGRVVDVPNLFRNRIEKEMLKEGIDSTTAFVSESVNEIHYVRPNQYREKVISIRKIGEDNNTSPNAFITSSFYESMVNGAVSPLSPQAFGYYRFQYLGFFVDGDYTVNKIQVIPRNRGDQVFTGVIYIVDGLWNIHSLNLNTIIWGLEFDLDQIYKPLAQEVWLPINLIFDVSGSFFGFDFEYQYLAHIRDYKIILNKDLTFSPVVIDDKLDRVAAIQADQQFKDQEVVESLTDLNNGGEISRKQLRKVLKEYEKQELRQARKDTEDKVISLHDSVTDSLAYSRDSTYWSTIRSIPLTAYEKKGYRIQDSLFVVAEGKSGDDHNTESDNSGKFLASGLLTGHTISISDHTKFGTKGLVGSLHFNTVEGFHFGFRPYLSGDKERFAWQISPELHYAFARDRVNFTLPLRLRWEDDNSTTVLVHAGRMVRQINEGEAINPWINDISTLFFESNYMKVFEKSFVELHFERKIGSHISFRVQADYAYQRSLTNHSDFVLFGSKERGYTSNSPPNREREESSSKPLKAFVYNFTFSAKPWLKYQVRNQLKSPITDSAPEFTIQYRQGIPGFINSDLKFSQLEFGFNHSVRFGIRGKLDLLIVAGTFLEQHPSMPLSYFKHFPGNQTVLTIHDPVASFRLLDYYEHSTAGSYLQSHTHYQFRKFLITRIPLVRLTGLKENAFVNYLETASTDHYLEVGYGINYIFRFLRLEFVVAFEDFHYRDFGIRMGIATNLETLFN
ncbi:MAG: DUF5686 and carboxypeptidase regulatory-like domain-containing protein [Saprospiraceae bacterium]|nr:DUF5686 and carboxypeptidase regulatory-like domain-containing protein [Saprospiraceae bacterium]